MPAVVSIFVVLLLWRFMLLFGATGLHRVSERHASSTVLHASSGEPAVPVRRRSDKRAQNLDDSDPRRAALVTRA